MKADFIVTGMSCAACVSRVEKAAGSVPGVEKVTVNLLTGDMRAEGRFDPSEVINAVQASGYGAGLRSQEDKTGNAERSQRKSEIRSRIITLAVSAAILLILFTVAMSYSMNMPEFPVAPRVLAVISGSVQAVLALGVIIVNYRIFISGFKALFRFSPNMDSLVATGVTASFLYSLALLIICAASNDPNARPVYYFESSAMILTFLDIGKLLEALAKGRAKDAVSALKQLVPDSCSVIRDGVESRIPTKEALYGDVIVLRPGDRIPLDGEVLTGSTEIDESSVTGESVPVYKKTGDKVISGTVNVTGVITARVTGVSGETTVDRMAELVREIASTKAPIAKIADKVAAVFVPAVMAISLAVFVIWMISGRTFGFSLERAVSVLVVSCPCALGLATPVAIVCGSATAAGRGVLFKSSEALEMTGRVKTVVFDKTGTVTKGMMKVAKVIPENGFSESELINIAALCESGGTHPIAAAVVAYAKDRNGFIASGDSLAREFIPGKGASVTLEDGSVVYCGKADFVPAEVHDFEDEKDFAGSTVFVSKGSVIAGRVLVSDSISDGAAECMEELKKRKIRTVMLTGDNEKAAKSVAEAVGIEEYRAGLLPRDKSDIVSDLSLSSKTAMVGDGINDAPALTAAGVGIAIGRGTDIAIESADVVITGTGLRQVSGAILLASKTLRIIYENLFWAFGYNIIGIPLAAGLFTLIKPELALTPAVSSIFMSVSSVLVVSNSLRLLASGNRCFGKPEKYENSQGNCSTDVCECGIIDTGNENSSAAYSDKGEKKMVRTTAEVKGMMCHNCERHVNNAVSKAFDVISVESDFEKNVTVIVSEGPVDPEKLKKVIEEEGYQAGNIVSE